MKKQNTDVMKFLVMLLLALYPLLRYYSTPTPFSIGDFIALILISIAIFKNGTSCLKFPKLYLLFWLYAAINLIYFANPIKWTYFIPGGISMFSWSLLLGISTSCYFDINMLRRIMKFVFVVAAVIFCAQGLVFLLTGSSFFAVPRLSNTLNYVNNMSLDELQVIQMSQDRFCSIFIEPSHFATYSLVLLGIELFSEESRNRFITPFSLIIILIIILIRSGCGILGLIVLLSIKLYIFSKKNKSKIFLLVLFVSIGLFVVLNSGIGEELLLRSNEFSEEGSSGFQRFSMGFIAFYLVPNFNKFFGNSITDIESFFNLAGFYRETGSFFTNAFQTLLFVQGIFGAILLIIVYYLIYRNSNPISKAFILLLLVLSFIDSQYFTPNMLLMTAISYGCKKENNVNTWK